MKKFLIVVLILIVIYALVKLSIKSPDENIPLANQESVNTESTLQNTTDQNSSRESIEANRITANYTGYGPAGKVENGSVSVSNSSLVKVGNRFEGSVVFDMNTITSAPVKDMLIRHLKSADFFDVEKYPTTTFDITSSTDTEIKGNLTMKGFTKQVTLPVKYDSTTGVYSSTVRVNMEDYGIKQAFTDNEFVLTVSVKK